MGLSQDRVVGERLGALLSGVVIKELDDEGLLAEVLKGILLGRLCRWGLSPRRPVSQEEVRA